MADWDNERRNSEGRQQPGWRGGRDWRDPSDPDPRDRGALDRPVHPRDRYGADPERPSRPYGYEGRPEERSRGGERPLGSQTGRTFEPGGGPGEGYGEGGDTPYGQMASGSSVSGLGGYSGADVGGWGQPVQNSQWGQGGFGPLNQGIDYGQDGGRFGSRGYDQGNFGSTPGPGRSQDEHHHHYRRWRDTQLASHDRDYSSWRDQQARRYDEDYGAWRNERHDAFSKEFEGWRAGRGGQASPGTNGPGVNAASDPAVASAGTAPYAETTPNAIHGANPTLAKIAEGHEGHGSGRREDRNADDKDVSRS